MKKILPSLLFTFICLSLFSQMRIIDPQNQWWQSDASIENVHFEIKPAGIFCETAITFDVKTTNSDFPNDIQLEYIYDFSMPDNVVYNNSWLWIEDYISQGLIYEKSEGTAIYEAIVDRQQDPSILTKNYDGSYNFRIYPLFDDTFRTVRLSYIAPLDIDKTNISSNLPLQFLRDSYNPPQNITLEITDNENWQHLPISDAGWIETGSVDNTKTYTLPPGSDLQDLIVDYTSDIEQEYTFGVYEGEDNNYFQLVFSPDIDVETEETNNLILFDYENDNSEIERSTILDLISDELNGLSESDNFNILYHDFTNNLTSDNWQSCTSSNIQAALSQVGSANISSHSWLFSLLPEALAYAEEMGQKTKIIIVSNDNDFYQQNASLEFLSILNEYIQNMSIGMSISVVDYSNYRPGSWISNEYYRGNEYLYSRLTQIYDGTYDIVRFASEMKDGLEKAFYKKIEGLDEYELDIESSQGFSYSKYLLNSSQKLRPDRPIKITGKYVGEVPTSIEFNAIQNGNFIQQQIDLVPNISLTDMAHSSWSAQYLLANENSFDSDIINDVINLSIEEGLLCTQTIFLSLERDLDSISSNNDDNDGDEWVVSTEDTQLDKIDITAYPNPFTEYINLEIPSDQANTNEEIRIQILSMDGKLIETINQKSNIRDGKTTITWTPDLNIKGGVYLIKIMTESDVQTIKVMLVR